MKASETRIDKFLANNETTFAIPVYQRNYDWTKLQCEKLFEDIEEAGSNEEIVAHFIGSIVYVHDDVYSITGLTELTIIDGQQRLTTLTLIYATIYRLALQNGDNSLALRVQKTFLINEFAPEEEKLKLKPTENNKVALAQILNASEIPTVDGYSRLIENFRLFETLINKSNMVQILKGLSKLIFVDIALERQKDNAQRIFESLNSTGLELSQADLIRNYILMGLSRAAQEELYKDYWEPIETNANNESINQSRVSDLIRDYLTILNKEIPNKGAVYQTFKEKFSTANSTQLKNALHELKILSSIYNKLLNPYREKDADIRKEFIYINSLEINVTFPFLMQVYRDYLENEISKKEFLDVLFLVQSFVLRRFIVGLPTSALNKIFMNLYDKIDRPAYLLSLQKSLLQRSGKQRLPRDGEVKAMLKDKPLYNTRPKIRMYFFEKLENYNNKEIVSIFDNPEITIEHIFPQNPEERWYTELSREEIAIIRDKYLNTCGNLTLSGNNGKLGNKIFVEKKFMNIDGKEQGYAFSRLWLNRHLKNLDSWGVEKIEERAELVAERFLKVWPMPDVEIDPELDGEMNIFDAEEPRYKKLEYAKFFGEVIPVKEVAKLYVDVISKLYDMQPEAFEETRLGDRLGLTSEPRNLRQALSISDRRYVEGNIDNISKFSRIKEALQTLELEDELYIRYA